ncbi:piggyBac transposable element-derived protein 4-like [Nilaparvata lugens]|uniref:piggyBac transposable element-derived protein 4-like n=1 Tax=Nilaparvata lugens TaxID=108931 RepID=UPI00193D84D9|nr:piggyBac transposable element-derived protein 4-like [Nilaparvata lugens]
MTSPLLEDDILNFLETNDDSDLDFELSSNDESDDSDDGAIIEENIPAAGTSSCSGSHKDITWRTVNVSDGPHFKLDSIAQYSGQSCIKFPKHLTPTETFHLYFPEEIYEHVAEQSNIYALQCVDATYDIPKRSRLHKLEEFTANQIQAFVAAQIGMGLTKKPAEDSFFQDSFWLTKTPGFSRIFNRDSYQLLKTFLHFNDNAKQIPKGQVGYDKLFKIRPLLDITSEKYMESYTPGTAIAIDKSMVKFKGRLSFKQYLPSKPSSKWGIKVWSMCDSSNGFMLKFRIYTGKETINTDDGLGARV